MAMSKPIPLATWKTWWGPELAAKIGAHLHSCLDPRKLPGNGVLLKKTEFKTEDLRDPLTGSIAEGLLRAYPSDKQPSGYLLGDAMLELDRLLGHCILGTPELGNPIKERSRRDDALTEGGKLKKLLSFVRTSACKSDVGRSCDVTYLKQLANNRVKRMNHRSSAAPSPAGAGVSPSDSLSSPASCDSLWLIWNFKWFWITGSLFFERKETLFGKDLHKLNLPWVFLIYPILRWTCVPCLSGGSLQDRMNHWLQTSSPFDAGYGTLWSLLDL